MSELEKKLSALIGAAKLAANAADADKLREIFNEALNLEKKIETDEESCSWDYLVEFIDVELYSIVCPAPKKEPVADPEPKSEHEEVWEI